MPLIVLIALASLYRHFAPQADMRAGMAVAAAVKMAWRLPRHLTTLSIGTAALVASSVVQLPLLP